MSRRCTVVVGVLGALCLGLQAGCPFPAVLSCGPDGDPCPEGSYCDPAEGYCVGLPEGGVPPGVDAARDAAVVGLDRSSGDSATRDRAALDGAQADAPTPDVLADGAPQDSAAADVTAPDLAVADGAAADTLIADAGASDRARPDTPSADTDLPDTDLPDTAAPDTVAPDTVAPDTAAPDTAAPDTALPDAAQPDSCTPPAGPAWWEPTYAVRFPLNVAAAPVDYTVEVSLSGAEASAVFGAATSSAGDDLRLVHHGASATEIDRELLTFSSGAVVLRFMIQEPGGFAGGAETYYLYAGDAAPAAPLEDRRGVYLFFEDFEGTLSGRWRFDPASAWVVADEGGNKVMPVNNGGRNIAEITGNSYQDLSITASMRFADRLNNNNGVFLRGTASSPSSNLYFWVAQLRYTDNLANIVEYNANYGTPVSTAFTVATDTWYQLEARILGSTMDLLVDGAPLVTTTNQEAGPQIGLFAYEANVAYDDVKVRRLISPVPAVLLGAIERPCS